MELTKKEYLAIRDGYCTLINAIPHIHIGRTLKPDLYPEDRQKIDLGIEVMRRLKQKFKLPEHSDVEC